MGAYLSEPVTEKCSVEETLQHFSYGASSMQGWRTAQEDAHNCIPDFDKDTALFGVYDGHGGAEVAQYCAQRLPEFIKELPTYKSGNVAQSLEDSFLGFDELIARPETVAILKHMAGIVDNPSDAESEVNHLYAEANMPIEEVLAKYKAGSHLHPNLQRVQEEEGGKPHSPFLRAKKCTEENEAEISSIHSDDGDVKRKPDMVCNGEKDEENACPEAKADTVGENEAEVKVEPKNGPKGTTKEVGMEADCGGGGGGGGGSSGGGVGGGDVCQVSSSTSGLEAAGTSGEVEPGCSHGKCSGKRVSNNKSLTVTDDSDDSSNSEDETYEEVPYADSDSDDDDTEEKENVAESSEVEEIKDEDEDEDTDEDDDDDDDDEKDEEDDESEAFSFGQQSSKEEPGSDSGCTAVVAILKGKELYVANAGDSRCIVYRAGKSIDMSVDHKPEDELEKQRIVNAGGKVTEDGRVNGGLNLSRAIGDHTYKRNRSVAPRDQMISALPDIRTLTIDPKEDKFMVLACDGIWNYMSSQEVGDFVNQRLDNGVEPLSRICEELFDHCLAPNTHGDGTGCDNMTAIIVKFHPSLDSVPITTKRQLERTNGTDSAKKMRQEDSEGAVSQSTGMD